MNNLERTVNRQVLKAAVAATITCPTSGDLLDVRSAVQVTFTVGASQRSMVVTAAAWDGQEAVVREAAAEHGIGLEVLDGRDLYPAPGAGPDVEV